MTEQALLSADDDDDDDADAAYEGISMDGVFMLKWKEKHRLTNNASLSPEWINEPNPLWGSRFRSMKHCDILYESFKKAGSINEHVNVVCLSDRLYEIFEHVRNDPSDMASRALLTWDALRQEGRGMEAFAGDHSRYVAKRLMQQYPKTNLWQKINKCEVYVCEDTSENRRVLRLLSNQDNVAQGLQLKQDFHCVVEQTHRHLGALRLEYKVEELPSQVTKQLRVDLMTSQVVKSRSGCNQIFQLGSYTGQTWDLVDQILKGDIKPIGSSRRPPKPPTSCYPFTMLAAIPEDKVITFLRKVVEGEWTFVQIRNACKTYKTKARVRKEVVTHVSAVTDIMTKHPVPTWSNVKTLYPLLAAKEFLDPWITWTSSRKNVEEMPSSFVKAMNDLLKTAKQLQVAYFKKNQPAKRANGINAICSFCLGGGGCPGLQDLYFQRTDHRDLPHGCQSDGQEAAPPRLQ